MSFYLGFIGVVVATTGFFSWGLLVVIGTLLLFYVFATKRIHGVVWCCLGIVRGVLVILFHTTWGLLSSSSSDLTFSGVSASGVVVQQLKPTTYLVDVNYHQYLLDTETLLSQGDTIEFTYSYMIESKKPQISIEDLTFPSLITGEFDYQYWLTMKGYVGHLYPRTVQVVGKQRLKGINKQRLWIQDVLSTHFTDGLSLQLIEGLILGGRRGISNETYNLFLSSGLVHILAVSGSNIMMVYAFVVIICFILPFYVRLLVALCAIVFYSRVCGLDSSVFRALIMGGLHIVAIFFGRSVSVPIAVRYSMICLLTANPLFLFYDMGFVLSYAALLGVWCSQSLFLWKLRVGHLRVIKNYIVPCCGATLGVLPILLLMTGSFNFLSLLANLVIVPLIPLFLLFSLGHVLFSFYVGDSILILLDQGVSLLLQLAQRTSVYGVYIHIEGQDIKLLVSVLLISIYVVALQLITENRKGCSVNGSTSVSEAEGSGSNPDILEVIKVEISK